MCLMKCSYSPTIIMIVIFEHVTLSLSKATVLRNHVLWSPKLKMFSLFSSKTRRNFFFNFMPGKHIEHTNTSSGFEPPKIILKCCHITNCLALSWSPCDKIRVLHDDHASECFTLTEGKAGNGNCQKRSANHKPFTKLFTYEFPDYLRSL